VATYVEKGLALLVHNVVNHMVAFAVCMEHSMTNCSQIVCGGDCRLYTRNLGTHYQSIHLFLWQALFVLWYLFLLHRSYSLFLAQVLQVSS